MTIVREDTVRFVSRFWTKVSQSNLCVKKNVVNNTPFFCNKMDKKSPKVILLLQNSEPFLFGCQKILKCIPHCHYIYEGLLLNINCHWGCIRHAVTTNN